MVSSEEARELAESWLRQTEAKCGYELVLLADATLEEDFGWVYFYNSRKFIETRNINWALGGNAPLIVERNSGTLHETGTAYPIETYVRYFGAHRTLEGLA